MSTLTNGRERKSLADQIAKLDQILDGFADNLNAAVAEPIRTTAITISTRLRNLYLRALTAAACFSSNRRRREAFRGTGAGISSSASASGSKPEESSTYS